MNSVDSNGFSIEIIHTGLNAPKHLIGGANYFSLPQKAEYKIKLSNNKHTRADAHVYIDGEKMGVWRIPSNGSISIERPVDNNKKFTFLKENTSEAREGGIVSGKNENGLIKVIFKPEKLYSFEYNDYDDCYLDMSANVNELYVKQNSFPKSAKSKSLRSMSNSYGSSNLSKLSNSSFSNQSRGHYSNNVNNFQSGGTALGAQSHQQFQNADNLHEIDHDNITTILARLVIDETTCYREYTPLSERTTLYPSRINKNNNVHKWTT